MGIYWVKYRLPYTQNLLCPPYCCSGTLGNDRLTVRHHDSCSGYPEALDASGPVLGASYPVENSQEREDLALEKGWERRTPLLLLASVRLWILG
jgi:hypothetical protein